MTTYDITHPLSARTAVWPGDVPVRYERSWSIARGASVNLGAVTLSLHAGSHADAPLHFRDGGASAAELDLDAYVGDAYLLDASGQDTIGVAAVEEAVSSGAVRILIRTGGWRDVQAFPTDFPVVDQEVPPFLGAHGVRLLGLDVPSVDRFDSKTLPNHHALAANGIYILESLRLEGVPPGRYQLIALPLPIEDGDGSPVRAILRTIDPPPR